ncbi:hypothetical protein [Tolypothrix sp. VBCCA 56010]|uniref:hypothetical protein n=1 Tax=Tolypothrix sp. VBCCA 56010 TaxID=3137731 RepID=UPI003D7E8D8C
MRSLQDAGLNKGTCGLTADASATKVTLPLYIVSIDSRRTALACSQCLMPNNYQATTNNYQPTTINHQLSTNNQQLTTNN